MSERASGSGRLSGRGVGSSFVSLLEKLHGQDLYSLRLAPRCLPPTLSLFLLSPRSRRPRGTSSARPKAVQSPVPPPLSMAATSHELERELVRAYAQAPAATIFKRLDSRNVTVPPHSSALARRLYEADERQCVPFCTSLALALFQRFALSQGVDRVLPLHQRRSRRARRAALARGFWRPQRGGKAGRLGRSQPFVALANRVSRLVIHPL